MSCNRFQRKDTLSTILAANVSSNISKKENNRRTYHSLQELQFSVFQYIEGYYNLRRSHNSLRILTSNEKRTLLESGIVSLSRKTFLMYVSTYLTIFQTTLH